MLGQIEREESRPTVAVLWKIASGFNTSFSSFLEDTYYNTQEAHNICWNDKNIHVTTVFSFDPEINCEIFNIKLAPNHEHLSLPHKPGVIEHVIITEGVAEVLVDGSWHKLKKGEGLRFDANQHHGYRNSTDRFAAFHNIIHYTFK